MKSKEKLLARYLTNQAVRNSIIEKLHKGITPSSAAKDFSDVHVVSPYGSIPWNELSRISDKEMRELMLDIEKRLYDFLRGIPSYIKAAGSEKKFYEMLEQWGFGNMNGVSWDLPKANKIAKKKKSR